MEDAGTKKRIIESAVGLFADSGYDGVGMRSVARATGIAVSVIYYYFKNKEELYSAAFLDYFNDVLSGVRSFIEKNRERDLISLSMDLLRFFNEMDKSEKQRVKVAIYEIQGFGQGTSLRDELSKIYKQHEMVFFSLFLERLKDKAMSFAASRVLYTYLSARVADIIIKDRFPSDTVTDDLKLICKR